MGHLIFFDELPGKLVQFLGRERLFDFQEIRSPHHALQMLGHAKRFAVEHPHGFEKPVTIHKPTVIYGDDSLRLSHELTVQKHIHAYPFTPESESRREEKTIYHEPSSVPRLWKVGDQKHTCFQPGRCAISLRAFNWSAARKPPALASVSSYSAAGTESATMPAPTWKYATPSLRIAVRMLMLSWLSRLKPR